jgi:hypothetical protein
MVEEISIKNILRIRKHIFFNNSVLYNDKINSILRNKIMILMLNAKLNKSTEALMLINNSNMKHLLTTNLDYNNVDFSYEMNRYMDDNTTNTYTAIHNHPNNSYFSIKDLKTFINYSSLAYVVVCTNSCQYIGMLGKTILINDNIKSRITSYIDKYIELNNLDEHSSAEKLIELLSEKGIVYAIYKNY